MLNIVWYVSKFRREQRTEFQCPLCGKVGVVEVFQHRLVIFRADLFFSKLRKLHALASLENCLQGLGTACKLLERFKLAFSLSHSKPLVINLREPLETINLG